MVSVQQLPGNSVTGRGAAGVSNTRLRRVIQNHRNTDYMQTQIELWFWRDRAQCKNEQGVVACWMPRIGLQVQEGGVRKEAAQVDDGIIITTPETIEESGISQSAISKRPVTDVAVLLPYL